jgi:hypothetical protein
MIDLDTLITGGDIERFKVTVERGSDPDYWGVWMRQGLGIYEILSRDEVTHLRDQLSEALSS